LIAVLPADCDEGLLAELCLLLEGRGWTGEVSRGEEQTVLVVSGPESLSDLEVVLDGRVDADVLPIGDARFYERRRRNRRRMHGLVGGLAILVALGLGLPVLSYLRAPDSVFAAYEFVPVTSFDRLQEHSAQLVRVHSRLVLVVRLEGERLFALSAECTYMEDCQLEWSRERQQIVCPCHGGVYDLYGNVVEGPPSIPLTSFDVDVVGSDIRVRRGV